MEFKAGFYRHHKGGLYYAMEVAQHTETQEELVIYWAVPKQKKTEGAPESKYWARPKAMFLDGRFTWVDLENFIKGDEES